MLIAIWACASVPNFALGATLSSYTTATTSEGTYATSIGSLFLKAGTGIQTGAIPTSVIYQMISDGTGTGSVKAFLRCYTTSAYSTGCAGAAGLDLYSASTTVGGAGSYSFAFASSTYVFDSTKYYALGAVTSGVSGGGFQMYGTGVPSGGAGDCFIPNNSMCYGALAGGALYFILNGSGDTGTNYDAIVSINSPTYGQVISSISNVEFSFDYYSIIGHYDQTGFRMVDNTALQSIDTTEHDSGVSQGVRTTFTAYKSLTSGHNYTWTPFLYNSVASTYLYGTSTIFFAGAQSNQSIPNSPSPLWNGCTNILCPGAIFSTSTGILTWNGGTTTSPFGPFGETLDSLLANKAPFSYLYDIKQVLFELGNGSTTSVYTQSCRNNDGYYTLPTGQFGTVLANGSTTVKFIDACAIQEMPVVKEIRKAMTYALYLITGIGLTGMAMSII